MTQISALFSKPPNVYTNLCLNGQMHRSCEVIGVSVLLQFYIHADKKKEFLTLGRQKYEGLPRQYFDL